MDDKTRIYNDDFEEHSGDQEPENENMENTEFSEEATSESPSPGYISLGVGVAAGLGAGILGTHIAYGNIFKKEDIIEEPSPIPETSFLADILVKAKTPIATGITEEMSLEEAYAFAREQIGPGGVFVWNGSVYGTYSEEEWSALSEEQQNDYYSNFNLKAHESQQVSLFDNVQLSTTVNDDMSFGEAFAAARSELGTGGVFMWQGNAYNTFYKEEWADMTSFEKESFIAGFLEIPDEHLMPTANVMQPDEADDLNEYPEGQDNEFFSDNAGGDDVPMAFVVDSEMINELYTPDNSGFIIGGNDDYPVADMETLSGMGIPETFSSGNDYELIPDNTDVNDFIHQMLNQGRRVEQHIEDSSDDSILPDGFVAGLGTEDDLDV